MKKLAPPLVFLALTSACLSGPKGPDADQLRAEARAAVSLSADAWNLVADACVDVAVAQKSHQTLQACKDALVPARGAIVVAADAVDAWTAAAQKDFPCAIADILKGLSAGLDIVHSAGGQTPQLVTDAMKIASIYAATCHKCNDDGGACQ